MPPPAGGRSMGGCPAVWSISHHRGYCSRESMVLVGPLRGGGHVTIDPPVRPRLEKTIFTYAKLPLGGSPLKYTRRTNKNVQKFKY